MEKDDKVWGYTMLALDITAWNFSGAFTTFTADEGAAECLFDFLGHVDEGRVVFGTVVRGTGGRVYE